MIAFLHFWIATVIPFAVIISDKNADMDEPDKLNFMIMIVKNASISR